MFWIVLDEKSQALMSFLVILVRCLREEFSGADEDDERYVAASPDTVVTVAAEGFGETNISLLAWWKVPVTNLKIEVAAI